MTYKEIVDQLNAKIPSEDVSERQGGPGFKLSYLEGWYVIDLLNQILGVGNWGYDSELTLVHSGETNGKYSSHYLAKVTFTYKLPDHHPYSFTDVGYGDGSDRNPGKSHELAAKEAITDGLKRCAKNLGMRLGLALYDKSKENVEYESSGQKKTQSKPPVEKKEASVVSRDALLKQVSQLATIADKKRRASIEDLKRKLKSTYGVERKEELSDEKLAQLAGELKELIK